LGDTKLVGKDNHESVGEEEVIVVEEGFPMAIVEA